LDINDCHIEAICTNTIGSYTCECQQGWAGDGIQCEGRNALKISGFQYNF